MVNENFCSDKKSVPFFYPFWSKIWPFLLKNQVFGHFVLMRTSDLSKTWSVTWDSCNESLKGSVVSMIILVILLIIVFKALRLPAAVFYVFFYYLAAAERPQHCALVSILSVNFL